MIPCYRAGNQHCRPHRKFGRHHLLRVSGHTGAISAVLLHGGRHDDSCEADLLSLRTRPLCTASPRASRSSGSPAQPLRATSCCYSDAVATLENGVLEN